MQGYPKHFCELQTEEEFTTVKVNGNCRENFKIYFHRLCIISKSNFRSYRFLRTRGAIQKEILKQKNSKHWYVVHPFSMLRLYWEMFMLAIYFIQLFFLPISCTFMNSYMAGYYTYAGRPLTLIYTATYIDYSLSVIFAIDILGYFITGYYDTERRETVMTPREIFRNYFFFGFFIDFSSSLPSDALIVLFSGMSSYAALNHTAFVFLEIYSVYRLIRLRRYFWYISQYSKLDIFSILLFRIILAIFIFVLLLHWMGALSVIVPEMINGVDLYKRESNKSLSWMDAMDFLEMSFTHQYALTLLNALQNNLGANKAADGLYSWEDYLLAILSSLIGRIYFIIFLIILLEAVTASSALKVKLRIILDELKVHMKQKDLPVSLKKRLSRFYLYRFQAHYFSNRAMLARLTESLRKEISMYTCQRLLHNTEVFQSIPKKVLTRFVQRMNREIYFPKDVIIQGNTFGECMYFICSGSVAVETLSEKEICRLGDGDFFGEIALIISDRRRIATIIALTITEVYRLEYSDYKNIVELYPDVYNRLEKFALERYRTTVLLEDRHDSRYRSDLR